MWRSPDKKPKDGQKVIASLFPKKGEDDPIIRGTYVADEKSIKTQHPRIPAGIVAWLFVTTWRPEGGGDE